MSGRTKDRYGLFAAAWAVATAVLVSSCAGSLSEVLMTSTEGSPSDSSLLLDDSKVGATEVSESGAFADLGPENTKNVNSTAGASEALGDLPFYSAFGGETIARVAITLYSDKSFADKLVAKNPDLKGLAKLNSSQKVYFEMESVRPEPTYLTKDLLDRYPAQLSARLKAVVSEKGLPMTSVSVIKGETLQHISLRLYGSHRYWPEIYLLNQETLKSYDNLEPGLTLNVISRSNSVIAAGTTESSSGTNSNADTPNVATSPEPEKKPVEAKAPLVVAPAANLPPPVQAQEVVAPKPLDTQPSDPIPETSSQSVAVQPPPPVTPPPPAVRPEVVERPAQSASVAAESNEPSSANSDFRRILYVALIVAIGAVAFYFTRTPKRPKVDMLDLNADATARPKLTPKDSQKSNIG